MSIPAKEARCKMMPIPGILAVIFAPFVALIVGVTAYYFIVEAKYNSLFHRLGVSIIFMSFVALYVGMIAYFINNDNYMGASITFILPVVLFVGMIVYEIIEANKYEKKLDRNVEAFVRNYLSSEEYKKQEEYEREQEKNRQFMVSIMERAKMRRAIDDFMNIVENVKSNSVLIKAGLKDIDVTQYTYDSYEIKFIFDLNKLYNLSNSKSDSMRAVINEIENESSLFDGNNFDTNIKKNSIVLDYYLAPDIFNYHYDLYEYKKIREKDPYMNISI